MPRLLRHFLRSEEIGADKPGAFAFEVALAKLGGVEGPVWFIGDNPEADLAGAKAAINAVTLQKIDEGRPASPQADAAFSDFGKLRKLFAKTA